MLVDIEKVLRIPDPTARLKALVDLAYALRLNPKEAKDSQGIYHEEKLVIMIYDAQKIRRQLAKLNFRFIYGSIILIVLLFGLMAVLPQAIDDFYRLLEAQEVSG